MRRYPADPPRVEEIVAVMRAAGDGMGGARMRGLIVVLWRAGLRIQEALDLQERDLDPRGGALLVRCGKGGRRRVVGMDDWGWEHLTPYLQGIDNAEIINTIHSRRPPMMPASAGLGLAGP